jgi:nitroreductase
VKNKAENNTCSDELLEIIRDRRSVRAFLPKPVSREIINKILETARWAPSGVNTQPWKVFCVGKFARKKISQAIIAAKNSGTKENPDYQYYPNEWVSPYKERRKSCGLAMYGALNITKEDLKRRQEQWFKNYYFFDAPFAMIFYMDKHLCKGSWMDMGMFIQNVMLAARCHGIETCPQAALAEHPDIIRNELSISNEHSIVCGMALGYPDWSHPINNYRTEREELDSFSTWID